MNSTTNKRTSRRNTLIEVYLEDGKREWEVDRETGEMVARWRQKKMPTFSDKYYGLDTKEIKDCNTKEQLIEVVSLFDGYTTGKTYVNDTFLTENVIAGNLTPKQLTFLRNLSKSVCVWNIYLGNRQELFSMGTDHKSLKRMLEELKHFIRVEREDVPYKGDIRISIHPVVVWKGDMVWRNYYREKWYGCGLSSHADLLAPV